MFSKAKNKQSHTNIELPVPNNGDEKPAANSQTTSKTQTSSKSSAKRSNAMKSPGVPSLISSDVTMEGNLISTGEVQFDGTINGNIRAASLIVGEKAAVKGEVACEAVTIRGRVEGMVRARNVALAATAHIEGDIMHTSLSVEPGAHFDGNCRHSEDPLADDASKAFDHPVSGGPGKSSPRPLPTKTLDESDAQPVADFATAQHQLSNGQGTNIRSVGTIAPANQQGSSSFLTKNRSPLR